MLNAHRPALLVSILSLHCTGTWPRSVLLALLTPNAMTDRETEELEEGEVKLESESPCQACCLQA